MADARAKAVINELADIYSRTNYIIDRADQVGTVVARGDVLEIPDVSALSVKADGATSLAPQSVTTNVLSLAVNRHPQINMAIPKVDAYQLLNGNWVASLARSATTQLKNHIDRDLADYIIGNMAFDTSGAYHTNTSATVGSAGDAIVQGDLTEAEAVLMEQEGEHRLAMFAHPRSIGDIKNIAGFIPAFSAAEQGQLGIPFVGSVNGIPVFMTQSAPRLRTVASTAWERVGADNELIITVAAGHGIVPGMPVTFDTATAGGDVSSEVAVTSVTATTVRIPQTGSDSGPNTEAGTLTVQCSENLMVDMAHFWVAQSWMPEIRIVPDPDSSTDALQVDALFGRVGRPGRAVVVLGL